MNRRYNACVVRTLSSRSSWDIFYLVKEFKASLSQASATGFFLPITMLDCLIKTHKMGLKAYNLWFMKRIISYYLEFIVFYILL